jgi:hypothetical protein
VLTWASSIVFVTLRRASSTSVAAAEEKSALAGVMPSWLAICANV